jgi:hypothetical protein
MKLPAIALLALLLPLPLQAQRTTLIGIWEPSSGDSGNTPGVRVLFYQSGRQWRSYNATCKDEACLKTITHVFPPTANWTVVKDGKTQGTLTATTPVTYRLYSEIGMQYATSVTHLEPHTTGQPTPPHTTLATTLPSLTDPDNWQPTAPFPLDETRARQDLRKLFPHPPNCDATGKLLPRSHPWTYTDAEIKLNAAYVSNKNWRLIQLTLGGYLCDGPPDPAFYDHWFTLSPTGEIHHLGHLMHLAGAADFANDGRSELLFEILDSNQGGYILFYDNFTQQAHATITHH